MEIPVLYWGILYKANSAKPKVKDFVFSHRFQYCDLLFENAGRSS